MEFLENFKKNPKWSYSLSIAASWAGVGSLLNSITITNTNGLIPSMIWGLANSFACILFGLVAIHLPNLRALFRTKIVRNIIGAMAVFQIWLNMNGIREVFNGTPIGVQGGTIIAYIVAIGFVLILLKFGMIRNVLTDKWSWLIVYVLIVAITIGACFYSGWNFNIPKLGLDSENLKIGFYKAFLLLSGPFTYLYYFDILDYNENNNENVKKTNMRFCFTMGGLLFGLYMLFTYVLAMVQFNPVLNLLKSICICFVGISTLSSFMFSIYLAFGRKIGLAFSSIAVIAWPLFIKMGVMGVWQFVASIRLYLVVAFLLIALGMNIKSKYNKKQI